MGAIMRLVYVFALPLFFLNMAFSAVSAFDNAGICPAELAVQKD